MLIRDLLQRKGTTVFSTKETASILDAVDLLNEKKIGSLVVLDNSEKVVGILSERDLLGHFRECASELSVSDIMTPREKLCIAHGEDSIAYAMSVMTENRVRHLPVFEGEDLIGLVSIGDVMKAFSEDLKFETKMLNEYISGSQGIVV